MSPNTTGRPSLNEELESSSDEWQLLDDNADLDTQDIHRFDHVSEHDLLTAPILTREAVILSTANSDRKNQYGVLGKALAIHNAGTVEVVHDQRLYLSTNAPFSAIICGVQGSGKSHTLSAILESMLIPNFSPIGQLRKALCGLVLHYGDGGPGALPNEAAWLSASESSYVQGPPVHVYVSHSSLNTMRAVYAPLGNKVVVEPLYFKKSELDAEAFLSMMAVGSSESAPLYMQVILAILRELGEQYSFKAFMSKLEESKQKFNPAQLTGLEQRMSLLMSFLEPPPPRNAPQRRDRFVAGQLTIIDLSDPFLDESSACGLFEIVIRLFIRAEVGTGKVLVVDEAHKYLSCGKGSTGLTKSLLRLIRQQRHLGMRVLISTQEPTVVPPVLLDLCSLTILHRFTSPSWWQHLMQHVSADFSQSDAFDKIVKLQTGQAIVLAPSGLGVFQETNAAQTSKDQNLSVNKKTIVQLGRRYIVMKTRRRVTSDGGASVLVLGS